MFYIYTVEYYSALLEKNEIMIFESKWMKIEKTPKWGNQVHKDNMAYMLFHVELAIKSVITKLQIQRGYL